MRGRDLTQPQAGNPAEARQPAATDPALDAGYPGPGWVARVSHPGWLMSGPPMVLRVPRGLAMLVVLGVVVILALAFFMGRSQGQRQGEQETLATLQASRQAISRGQPDETGSVRTGVLPRRGRIYLPNQPDPREAGMNYLILARYPLDEAQRLTEFLADQGLDSVIVPSHTTGLFQVIALHGFTSEQYRAGEYRAFEREIHRIGQRWREINAGRGDDLRTRTYWARYEPRS